MNRLVPYFLSPLSTRDGTLARACDVLEFCHVIIRIHRESGDSQESELADVRDLELWASVMLKRYG